MVDWQSESDLDSICKSCDVFKTNIIHDGGYEFQLPRFTTQKHTPCILKFRISMKFWYWKNDTIKGNKIYSNQFLTLIPSNFSNSHCRVCHTRTKCQISAPMQFWFMQIWLMMTFFRVLQLDAVLLDTLFMENRDYRNNCTHYTLHSAQSSACK